MENVLPRRAVRIGSGVAPSLSDILLAKVDRPFSSRVHGTEVVKRLRYVDDFRVVFIDHGANSVEKVESVFHVNGEGLKFVEEVPEQDVLQLLDISVKLGDRIKTDSFGGFFNSWFR